MAHLRDAAQRAKESGATTLMWAIGVGMSVVLALFGLLWATGTVGS
jgi:predicted naringenin-chalcone synthase